jgi:hypothetical protein
MRKLITGFAILLVVTVSCKKSETTPLAGGNPTHYLLTRETYTNGTPSANEGLIFTYNSNNLVIGVKRYANIISGSKADTIYTTFQYNKYDHCSMVVSNWSFNAGYPDTMLYQYADPYSSLITSAVHKGNSGGVAYTTTYYYTYDAYGNLSTRHDTSGGSWNNFDYTYDAMGNLQCMDMHFTEGAKPRKARYEFPQFDDKVNYMLAVNGLPPLFWNYGGRSASQYPQTAAHNATLQRLYTSVNEDQPFNYSRDDVYTYEYNEDGLPTKMSYKYGTFTFEYKKYK